MKVMRTLVKKAALPVIALALAASATGCVADRYMKSKGDVWFARKDEIARWALKIRTTRPSCNA
jgi:hypothetical protein